MTTYVAVFALVLAYLAVVGAYLALRTLARLRRATALLSGGETGGRSIVEVTEAHIAQTRAVAAQLAEVRADLAAARAEAASARRSGRDDVDAQLSGVAADNARSLRNVALVRYDAFDDMAGRMSFSLALLDDRGDGVALSAIAGRSDTRVYAKGVAAGRGEHELSPEEAQAVRAALRPAARDLPARRAS